MEELGVDVAEFSNHVVSGINRRTRLLIRNHGWSPRRTLDPMHVLATLRLDCDGVIAVDRFIARRAKEYGLLYANQYTGAPRMGKLYKEWRRLRDQAEELLYLVGEAEDTVHGREAWRIYEE